MYKLISMIVIMFSLQVHAANQNLDGFTKRFKIIKDESGKVTYVQMNLFTQKLSIMPYLQQIKADIKEQIQAMSSKSFDQDMDVFLEQLRSQSIKSVEQEENIFYVERSLRNLKSVDVDKFFNDKKLKDLLKVFKEKMQNALKKYSLVNIASTQDPKYFYKRNVTYAVVTKVLDLAKKQFSEVPLLNLASFVVVKVHDMLLEQRLYHQNMLLHYLQNFKEAELGITIADADKIFSSIYESRIPLTGYNESQEAAQNWTRYGLNKFYAMVRTANNRLRRSNSTMDSVGKRVNFAFFHAKEDGKRVIKNLVHNKHMFSRKMATAFYVDEPNKVRKFRSLLNLSQVALGFLPIPDWIKSQVDGFVDSFYKKQQILEGALVGYFESENNRKMSKLIKSQIINPYIK